MSTSTAAKSPATSAKAPAKSAVRKTRTPAKSRRQMEEVVIETMQAEQSAKSAPEVSPEVATPKIVASREVPVSKTTDASRSKAGRAAEAAKKAPKAPAKIQTEPLVGVLRDGVDDVIADWTRAIPGVHSTDAKCGGKFTGEHRDRNWLQGAFAANQILGDKGEARTFWFHSCVVAKTPAAPKAPVTAEVVIDLSAEPTAELDERPVPSFEEIGRDMLNAADEDVARTDVADHVASADSDPELEDIKAEVAEALKTATRKARVRKTAAQKRAEAAAPVTYTL